jgi:hypothetical protein
MRPFFNELHHASPARALHFTDFRVAVVGVAAIGLAIAVVLPGV